MIHVDELLLGPNFEESESTNLPTQSLFFPLFAICIYIFKMAYNSRLLRTFCHQSRLQAAGLVKVALN
jgi:hypothetical protein